jgi:hypothetical protein
LSASDIFDLTSLRLQSFRAAVDMDGIAGDAAGVVGGEEGEYAADVARLGEACQRLDAER